MKKQSSTHRWLSLAVLLALLISPALLQGCDGFSDYSDQDERALTNRESAPVSAQHAKLRHPQLLDAARGHTFDGTASKGGQDQVHLLIAFNEYEADGITKRVLDKYGVTKRILNQYGITRRVLGKYGITKRILNQYGITRRILNQYDVTRRILNRYGLITRYGDVITEEMLSEFNLTPEALLELGLSESDIADYNTLSELVNEHDLSPELFEKEMENFEPKIRLKVRVSEAGLGITVAIDSELLETFLEEISDDPDILFVEPDAHIDNGRLGKIDGNGKDFQVIPWGLDRIGGRLASLKDLNKVHVYVFDSGVIDHDLNVGEKRDFTMLFQNRDDEYWDEDAVQEMPVYDPKDKGDPLDYSGHGTHVAGIIGAEDNDKGILGLAPKVKIHNMKVLDEEGRTDMTTVMAAVDFVTQEKLDHPDRPIIVNMSLGTDIGTTAYNMLDEAVERSIEAGVVYIVSAGNDGKDASTYSPAHVEGVITVGSYDENETFSSFSNYGPVVDILAPGENIISLTHLKEELKEDESVLNSGTSFAAPHVTAAAALYMGLHRDASPDEVHEALMEYAKPGIQGVPFGTTNKTIFVGEFARDEDDDKDFKLKKVEYDKDEPWLFIKGEGRRLDTIVIYDGDTDEELTRTTVDFEGKWELQLENLDTIPCTISARWNGVTLTDEVEHHPGDCN